MRFFLNRRRKTSSSFHLCSAGQQAQAAWITWHDALGVGPTVPSQSRVYCAHTGSANPAASPLLFSTALPRAVRPPCLLLPFFLLCSKHVFCPRCPTTFLSLHSSRRSLVVHSQPSSSHYCPNKKNYTQHMACAVTLTPCLSQSRHCQYQTAVLHVSFISSLMCKPLCCSSLLCIKVICGARKYLYNLYLEYQNYTWISTCLLTSSIYHENKSIIDVPMTTRSRRGQSHSRLQGY